VRDHERRVTGAGKRDVRAIDRAEGGDHGDVGWRWVLAFVDDAIRRPEVDGVVGHVDLAVGARFDIEAGLTGVVSGFGVNTIVGVCCRAIIVEGGLVEKGNNVFQHCAEAKHYALIVGVGRFARCDSDVGISQCLSGEDWDNQITTNCGLKVLGVVVMQGGFGRLGGNGETCDFSEFDFQTSGDSEAEGRRRYIVRLEVQYRGDGQLLACVFGEDEVLEGSAVNGMGGVIDVIKVWRDGSSVSRILNGLSASRFIS
jgi:hypothetical protein